MLNTEDEVMRLKFKELMNAWPTQVDRLKGAPFDLFQEILAQKDSCNEMLRSKNSIIEMFESENRVADENYKELIQEYHTNIRSNLSNKYCSHSKPKFLSEINEKGGGWSTNVLVFICIQLRPYFK